jgi:hypothetical protein
VNLSAARATAHPGPWPCPPRRRCPLNLISYVVMIDFNFFCFIIKNFNTDTEVVTLRLRPLFVSAMLIILPSLFAAPSWR